MAVFAFLVLSISDDLLAYGSALLDCRGGSWTECKSQLASTRNERQFEALLKRHYSTTATSNCSSSCHSTLQFATSSGTIEMSTESIDSCDFAYQEVSSPGSLSLDKSSSTEIVHTVENITEVSPGLCFVITGTIQLTCERFSLNLLLKNGDVALHFNPRLPQNYIVRNCRVKGCWGREEVASPLSFNLHRGQRFAVQVLVTDKEFLICVNGRHFNAFRHRLPYRKICTLEVKGDVREVAVDQCYMECYPQLELELIRQLSPDAAASSTLIVPRSLPEADGKPMPYTGVLQAPFTDGYKLHLYGRVKLLPHSFYVNLQSSAYVWPHPSILFHLNPRFGSVGGRHVICRNSWLNGKWDREERSENMTDFAPGKAFHLQITCTDVSYQVSLNDKMIAEFVYRDNPRLVEAVYIQGDIKIVIKKKNNHVGIRYEYTLPSQHNKNQSTYYWKLTDWSVYSAPCGGGKQFRESICYHLGKGVTKEELCLRHALGKRHEPIVRDCNDDPCPFNWWVGPWQLFPITCRNTLRPVPIRRRSILCVDSNAKIDKGEGWRGPLNRRGPERPLPPLLG